MQFFVSSLTSFKEGVPFSPAAKTSDIRTRYGETTWLLIPSFSGNHDLRVCCINHIFQGGRGGKGFGIRGWDDWGGHCDAARGYQNGTERIRSSCNYIQLREGAKAQMKKGGRLIPVKEVLTKVESGFNALVNRWTDKGRENKEQVNRQRKGKQRKGEQHWLWLTLGQGLGRAIKQRE